LFTNWTTLHPSILVLLLVLLALVLELAALGEAFEVVVGAATVVIGSSLRPNGPGPKVTVYSTYDVPFALLLPLPLLLMLSPLLLMLLPLLLVVIPPGVDRGVPARREVDDFLAVDAEVLPADGGGGGVFLTRTRTLFDADDVVGVGVAVVGVVVAAGVAEAAAT